MSLRRIKKEGKMKYRTEHDSMGEVMVPADRYWGAQTQRSRDNFRIGAGIETMPEQIITAFGILKKAAARANHALRPEKMTDEKLALIEQACDEVISGALKEHFPLKPESVLEQLSDAKDLSRRKDSAFGKDIRKTTGRDDPGR